MTKIGVIVNPKSRKNRASPGRRTELERIVGDHGIVRETRSLAELPDVVEELVDRCCEYWVCDGGDGTLHWLLTLGHEALARRGGETRLPRIVPANGGSIDFVARKAGIRGQAPAILESLVGHLDRAERPTTVELDTLRIEGRHRDSAEPFDRIGFAAAIGGVAQRVFGKLYQRDLIDSRAIADVLASSLASIVVNTAPRPLRPLVPAYVRDYANEIVAPTPATVRVDGERLPFESFASLQVGSIDINLGGVVRTFRHAAAPGVLHLQAISMSPLGVAANLPNIVFGTPIWGGQVFDGPATEIEVNADDEPLAPVVDGEVFGGLDWLRIRRGPRLEIPVLARSRPRRRSVELPLAALGLIG